jgi:dihydropteroate synthase
MGVVNCTPDSFSDGGEFFDPDLALQHAEALLEAGALIIDVGGESTRPGAAEVDAATESARVLPLIRELARRHPDAILSVDTCKAEVAEAALAAGALIVNDVSAAADPAMLPLVAAHEATLVLMHRRGSPASMQQNTSYEHVVAEVHDFLARRARAAEEAGVAPRRIWLDPGIGFGKDDRGNLQLLAALPDLAALGYPVLVGPSRKSFIGRLTGAPVHERLPGTLASLIPVVGLDRVVVRVHEPAPVLQFLEIATRLRGAA